MLRLPRHQPLRSRPHHRGPEGVRQSYAAEIRTASPEPLTLVDARGPGKARRPPDESGHHRRHAGEAGQWLPYRDQRRSRRPSESEDRLIV